MFVYLEEKYKRKVLVIPVDFSCSQDVLPNVVEKLKDLEIGVLGEFTSSSKFLCFHLHRTINHNYAHMHESTYNTKCSLSYVHVYVHIHFSEQRRSLN